MSAAFIPSWTAAGRIENIADTAALTVDFAWISATLSGLARFNNKQDGPPLSVAQHCVQGADALLRETGDAHLAGLFLLHDAHEAWLGDITTPIAHLIDARQAQMLCRPAGGVLKTLALIKAEFDGRIYGAAGYADPAIWPEKIQNQIAGMDRRMAEIEAYELFGPDTFAEVKHSGLPTPKLTGSICPVWGTMKAEEAFNERLKKYCGIDVRVNPRGIAP